MCDCRDGRSLFDDRRVVTARKEYVCGECEDPILVGTKYIYRVGKWIGDTTSERGEFWTFRMCLECDADWDLLTEAQHEARGETCICYGELGNLIEEAFDEGVLDSTHPLVKKWLPDAADEASEATEGEETPEHRPTLSDGQPDLPF